MVDLDDALEAEEKIIREIRTFVSIGNVVGANEKQVIYASAPLTTGPEMYDALEFYKLTSTAELKVKHPAAYNEIFKKNTSAGVAFATELRERNKDSLVICPAPFFRDGFTQEHYMAFWEQVISRFADQINSGKGWELSSGCVEESFIGFRLDLPVHEEFNEQPLSPAEAVEKILPAIARIKNLGADYKQIYNFYRRLKLIA